MTNRSVLIMSFALAGPLVANEERETETVTVAGLEVRIPMPGGFARVDGLNGQFDALQKKFLPPTNKLLLYVATEEARQALEAGSEPDLSRTMNIQVLRELEGKNISPRDFRDLREVWRGSLGGSEVKDEVERFSEKASKELREAGSEVDVKISLAGEVGVIGESDNHLMFAMEVDQGVSRAGTEVRERGYVAGSFLRVHGKVINLYCNSSTSAPEDRQWARETLESWQAAILGANDELAGKMASIPESRIQTSGGRGGLFSGVLRWALIGAAIGAVVGIVAAVVKARGKGSG